MSIRTDILAGMKKSRKKYFNNDQLDEFATDGAVCNWPTMHGVRARISELHTSGQIVRVSENKYRLPIKDVEFEREGVDA